MARAVKSTPAKIPTEDTEKAFKLLAVMLYESDFTLLKEQAGIEKSNREIKAVVWQPRRLQEGDRYFFGCEFTVRRKETDTELPIQVSATYGCIIRSTEEDAEVVKKWAEEIARSAAWPRFSDLFSFLVAQGRQVAPHLPISSPEITIRPIE